jgi:hypothetical protein
MRWAGLVARMEDRRVAYRVLVWIHVRKRPLGRPKRIREDNNKMDIQKEGWRT